LRGAGRVEAEQEDQGAIVVEVELAAAGAVALTSYAMEPVEEGQSLAVVLEPL
jgi:hypothetical protein